MQIAKMDLSSTLGVDNKIEHPERVPIGDDEIIELNRHDRFDKTRNSSRNMPHSSRGGEGYLPSGPRSTHSYSLA